MSLRPVVMRYYAIIIRFQLLSMVFRERLNRKLLLLPAALFPGAALAEGDVADMIGDVATGAESGQTSSLKIAQFVGVVIALAALFSFKKIGQNPQFTMGRCIVGLVVGVLLLAGPELMNRSQRQMGISATSID
ncbi:conjugal transfer protein TraR [Salmonella enterica subsp. enterica]|nr:conjugal transfer protein TraR [Salmonella enterica subsp. enterica]MIF52482.1 conjugal transfer protein TraR [Salmonella enterica subsp. enterica]